MAWFEQGIERLRAQPVCGYHGSEPPAVEPTALAALALAAGGHRLAARPALDWLLAAQNADGALGIDASRRQPYWPTGWAILAWNEQIQPIVEPAGQSPAEPSTRISPESPTAPETPVTSRAIESDDSMAARRATEFLLAAQAQPILTEYSKTKIFGHDTTLRGWPWVLGTHGWVEPTAINLLALRRCGKSRHPRYREATRLLIDRQLPDGGWNYGNTTVFDQVLRPHVQPTGLALAALAGETDIQPKIVRSIDYLGRELSERTTTSSLCHALMGLVEHGVRQNDWSGWLESAWQRTIKQGAQPYLIALLVLTAAKVAGDSHRQPEPWESLPATEGTSHEKPK